MTVIRPNSVSGITSITAQASEINFFRSNGALAGLQLNGVNFNTTTGISTFNNLNVGGVLTYQDVTNVDSLGIGTFGAGIDVSGGQLDLNDNIKIRLGDSQDLEIYHDGSNSFIKDAGTGSLWLYASEFNVGSADGNEAQLKCDENGAVELYHNNTKRFETTSYGGLVTGNLAFGDNDKASFGASGDLQIFHSGSNSFINDLGTGGVIIAASKTNIMNSSAGENMAVFNDNGAVELYYDNVKRFETLSTGAKVTGRFEQFGNSTGSNDTNSGFARNVYRVEIAHNTTKTFTFTGLNAGWATIKMGGYSSNGGSAMSFRAELGGWMFYTGSANYGATTVQDYKHNTSTSVTKNATSYVVAITNNASNSTTLALNLCTEATQTAFAVAIS